MTNTLTNNLLFFKRSFFFPLAAALASVLAQAAAAEETRQIHVSHVSASAVYVDGGSALGLAVGDRLQVLREGEAIAVLEVSFVAAHSASCTILSQSRNVDTGDQVVLIRAPSKAPAPEVPVAEPEAPRPTTVGTLLPEPPNDARELVDTIGQPWAEVSGSLSLRYQTFEDSLTGRGFDEGTGRLSLRLREIGGHPFELRTRLRSRQVRRDTGETDAGDRLYELSLLYDPPEGHFSFQLGRLGASPFLSLGYLDGVLAQYRFNDLIAVGGFFGSRSEIEELGLKSAGEKYGTFVKLARRPSDSPFFAEAVIAGIGEYEGGEPSREYVSLESRFGSRRWSFSQLAEIDLLNDWRRGASGESQQVSNLSLAGWFRPRDTLRVSLSYDQRRRFRTLETRPIPEELFNDQLRQGLRFGVHYGKPRGWNVSTTLGYRSQEQGDASTSFAGSIYHTSLGDGRWLVGGDFSGYSGDTADGYMVTLRTRRALGRHDLGLVLGASSTTLALSDETRENQWIRLTGSLRLPQRLYLLVEVEYNDGDDLQGQRFIVELVRRF